MSGLFRGELERGRALLEALAEEARSKSHQALQAGQDLFNFDFDVRDVIGVGGTGDDFTHEKSIIEFDAYGCRDGNRFVGLQAQALTLGTVEGTRHQAFITGAIRRSELNYSRRCLIGRKTIHSLLIGCPGGKC